MKMKNRWRRYGKNRPKPRYSKCKKCLNVMWLICIKQHLSNIWSWIHEKVKQHWGWVEKKLCLLGSYKAKALAWPETKNLVYFLWRKVHIRSICLCKSYGLSVLKIVVFIVCLYPCHIAFTVADMWHLKSS